MAPMETMHNHTGSSVSQDMIDYHVEKAREILEAKGYEVLVFHSDGISLKKQINSWVR